MPPFNISLFFYYLYLCVIRRPLVCGRVAHKSPSLGVIPIDDLYPARFARRCGSPPLVLRGLGGGHAAWLLRPSQIDPCVRYLCMYTQIDML